MTQGTLIDELCTCTAPNRARRAIFEFDKLVRSIYTRHYLRNPQLERNMHRSQNRMQTLLRNYFSRFEKIFLNLLTLGATTKAQYPCNGCWRK